LEKFWGERALEYWKSPWLNRKDLAVSLLKGKTLVGLSKKEVMDKLGESELPILLPTSSFEETCLMFLITDEKDMVSDVLIFPMN
jgi:hypothetical protein